MCKSRKVVLVSKSGYDRENPSHYQLLVDLHARGIGLFCAVGKDCEIWHDQMDDVCVFASLDFNDEWRITTTWHEAETLEEVLEFARSWDFNCYDSGIDADSNDVEIVEA